MDKVIKSLKSSLEDKTLSKVQRDAIQSTIKELITSKKPESKSRVWKNPKGYQYLGVWQNAALLRVFVRMFTKTLPRSEYRLKAQMDDEAYDKWVTEYAFSKTLMETMFKKRAKVKED